MNLLANLIRNGRRTVPLVLVLLVARSASAGGAPEVWRGEVLRWIERIKSDQPITLADYNWWNSNKDETEIEFEESECETRGWSVSKSDERCVKYMQGREAIGEKAPSIFYSWLRSRLCTTCPITIQGSERRRLSTPKSDYELITVIFGATKVELAWYLDKSQMDVAGRLPVVAIDGRPISEAVDAEISRRRAEGARIRSKSSGTTTPTKE